MSVNNRKIITKKNMLDVIYILLGCAVLAIAIDAFLLPAKISTGGATGVGNVLFHLYQIPVSATVLVINIPLFIIALKKLGLRFCIRALFGTAMLTVFIQMFSFLTDIKWLDLSGDLFLSSIFGGILTGLGLSLVFKGGGSTGGSDILAQIVYKIRALASISQAILMIDGIVVVLTMIAFKNVLYGLYSMAALYISNKVIDIIFGGVNYSKVINIITSKPQDISDGIIQRLDRGVTSFKCIGEYTNKEYTLLTTVVNKQDIATVKSIVKDVDSQAFLYISPASEVVGLGFKEA